MLTMLALLTIGLGAVQADARLQLTLDSTRNAIGAPGASAAVILPDGRLWTGGSGIASAGRAVTPETVFELASVTKTYIATLALLLAEAGRLSLDARLAEWFPGLPHADRITVRQLLNHTSGLHDPAQEPDYVPAILAQPAAVWTVPDLLARMQDAYHAPGEGWHYTNTGYHLVGEILGAASGDSLHELLRGSVFGPLGLARSYFGGREVIPEPMAHAFIDLNDDGTPEDLTALIPSTAFLTAAGAAGAVLSNAADVVRFLRAVHSGEVLSPGSYGAMTTWVDRPDGHRYGLGTLRIVHDGRALLGHKGNSAGFSAAAFHVPDANVTVAVLTNAHGVDVAPVAYALLAQAIRQD